MSSLLRCRSIFRRACSHTMRETVIAKGWSVLYGEVKTTYADCQRDLQVDNLADAELE
jgi:hypothetical protein